MKNLTILKFKWALFVTLSLMTFFSSKVYATSGIITGNDEVKCVDDGGRGWAYSDGPHDATCTLASGNWMITSSTTMTFKLEFNNRFGINYNNIYGTKGTQSLGYIDLYYKTSVSSSTTYTKRVLYLLTEDSQHTTGSTLQIMGSGQGTVSTPYSKTFSPSLASLAGKIITSVKLHAYRNGSKIYCDRIRISGVDFNNVTTACTLDDDVTLVVSSNPTCSNASAGAITIKNSGAVSGTSYKVVYKLSGTRMTKTVTANSSGYLILTGLTSGTYTIVSITDNTNSNCVSTPSEEITIATPDCCSLDDDVTLVESSSPTCDNSTASITIKGSGAVAGNNYKVVYTVNSGSNTTVTLTADSDGNFILTGLAAGDIVKIISITSKSDSTCSSTPGASITISTPDCIDSDGDGVVDAIDKDDDNDGILDTDEQIVTTQSDAYAIAATVTSSTVNYPARALKNTPATHANFAAGSPGALKLTVAELSASQIIMLYMGTNAKNSNNPTVVISDNKGGGFTQVLPAKTAGPTAYSYTAAAGVNTITVTKSTNKGVVFLYRVVIKGSGSAVMDIDTDGDGIPNRLDLDSDGQDGCADALEAEESVTSKQLDDDRRIDIANLGGIDSDGVPNLVNSGGAADDGNKTQGQATTKAVTDSTIAACEIELSYPITRSEKITSISSSVENSLSITPNPTKGDAVVRLNSNEEAIADFYIINMTGLRVFQTTIEANKSVQMNLNNLSSGVYMVVCKQAGNVLTKKLILK